MLPFFLAGSTRLGNDSFEVVSPFDGRRVARIAEPEAADVEAALAAAHAARRACAAAPVHVRKRALERLRDAVVRDAEEFARLIALCVGKPIGAARAEVQRASDTFDQAAALCTRAIGEVLPLDSTPRGENTFGLWKRVPIGALSLVTPFNFPLNLVAHKIAPALAAGCPFVLKPAREGAPVALRLAAVLAECDLPTGAFSVLPVRDELAGPLVEDARVALLSFTGSSAVGHELARRAGTKRVLLELGGVATCIVDADADLEFAAQRILFGAFGASGQSCISVQRVVVHADLRAELEARLVAGARALAVGDPLDENTVVGPLLRERDAVRIEEWLAEAVRGGARVLCGGTRSGRMCAPTLVADAPPRSRLVCEEVFGPVAVLSTFTDFDALLGELAQTSALHVGLFTHDWRRVLEAFDVLDVGGLVVGDVPTVRADLLPYGGSGATGLGREGVAFALEAMTQSRSLLVRREPKG